MNKPGTVLKPVCPSCGSTAVIRIEPIKLTWRGPTHRCSACGSRLVAQLQRVAAAYVALGILLMLAVFGLFEATKSLATVSPLVPAGVALLLLYVVHGFAASRVLRSIQFKVWPKA